MATILDLVVGGSTRITRSPHSVMYNQCCLSHEGGEWLCLCQGQLSKMLDLQCCMIVLPAFTQEMMHQTNNFDLRRLAFLRMFS